MQDTLNKLATDYSAGQTSNALAMDPRNNPPANPDDARPASGGYSPDITVSLEGNASVQPSSGQVDAFQIAAAADPAETAKEVGQAKAVDNALNQGADGMIPPSMMRDQAVIRKVRGVSSILAGGGGAGGSVGSSVEVSGGGRVEAVQGGASEADSLSSAMGVNRTIAMQSLLAATLYEKDAAEAQAKIDREKALLQAEKNKEDADIMTRFAEGTKRIQEDTEIKFNALGRRLDSMIDQHSKMRINRDFFRDKTTGQQIAAAIAVTMGSYASAMTGGPNVALKIIDDAIQRDLDLQQQEIVNSRGNIEMVNNRMAQVMQQGMTMIQARQLAEAATLKATQSMFDSAIASQRVKMDPYYTQQVQNTLNAKGAAQKASLHMSLGKDILTEAGVRGQLLQMDTMRAQAKSAERAALKGSGEYAAHWLQDWGEMALVSDNGKDYRAANPTLKPEMLKNAHEAYTTFQAGPHLLNQMRAFRDLINKEKTRVGGNMEKADWSSIESAYGQLIPALKAAVMPGSGTFDEGVEKLLGKAFPHDMKDLVTGWNNQAWNQAMINTGSLLANQFHSAAKPTGVYKYTPAALRTFRILDQNTDYTVE